ncbi:MAG TPA: hypothetical protein VKR80_08350 [Candidatus Limnocylindria bacterium]|nr:hypothetical protein [Candidatus Limnocylindria bacterium]
MEPLDYAALASFVALVLAWVVLPIKAPATAPAAETLEPAAIAA